MNELPGRSSDLDLIEQEFLTVQELSQDSQGLQDSQDWLSSKKPTEAADKQYKNREEHLPVLELNDASLSPATATAMIRTVSQSARDLGAPLEANIESKSDLNSLIPKRIDPRTIAFHIGRSSPQPYYDRYAAGVSVTATHRISSSEELNGRTDISIGVGAEYANPNTRVQIFAQPLGTEQRYGVRFSTSF